MLFLQYLHTHYDFVNIVAIMVVALLHIIITIESFSIFNFKFVIKATFQQNFVILSFVTIMNYYYLLSV